MRCANLTKEVRRRTGFYAFLFKENDCPAQKLALSELGTLGRKVESDIFVDPYPAFPVLIDKNHSWRRLKTTESVKEAFESDERFFD